MADEAKRHPPTERKLARLWEAGSTPASPALVGAAVLGTVALLLASGGDSLAAWLASWVREGVRAAAQPGDVVEVARSFAFRGGILISAILVPIATAALVVQIAQAGRRSTSGPSAPASREDLHGPRFQCRRLGRAVLLIAVAAVLTTATVRAVLFGADALLDLRRPAEALAGTARSVGLPLVVVLMAVGVLDALAERAAWMREAWMTRREVEEELRETEGHPLTRRRREIASGRRSDA